MRVERWHGREKGWGRIRRRPRVNLLPYSGRSSLLTRGELAFYQVLFDAIGGRWGISLKTRLADVVRCPASLWKTPHGRRVSQKHLDFVLYDINTARIIATIELDDRSHERPERVTRDAFVNRALLEAGVVLIRFRAAASYRADLIRGQLQDAIDNADPF